MRDRPDLGTKAGEFYADLDPWNGEPWLHLPMPRKSSLFLALF